MNIFFGTITYLQRKSKRNLFPPCTNVFLFFLLKVGFLQSLAEYASFILKEVMSPSFRWSIQVLFKKDYCKKDRSCTCINSFISLQNHSSNASWKKLKKKIVETYSFQESINFVWKCCHCYRRCSEVFL